MCSSVDIIGFSGLMHIQAKIENNVARLLPQGVNQYALYFSQNIGKRNFFRIFIFDFKFYVKTKGSNHQTTSLKNVELVELYRLVVSGEIFDI